MSEYPQIPERMHKPLSLYDTMKLWEQVQALVAVLRPEVVTHRQMEEAMEAQDLKVTTLRHRVAGILTGMGIPWDDATEAVLRLEEGQDAFPGPPY